MYHYGSDYKTGPHRGLHCVRKSNVRKLPHLLPPWRKSSMARFIEALDGLEVKVGISNWFCVFKIPGP